MVGFDGIRHAGLYHFAIILGNNTEDPQFSVEISISSARKMVINEKCLQFGVDLCLEGQVMKSTVRLAGK